MNLFVPALLLVTATAVVSGCTGKAPNTYRPAPAIGAPQSNQTNDVPFEMPQQAAGNAAPAPAAAVAASGMNPEHGQPGHRCDIPVGSPLNSTAQKPAQNEISTMVVPPSSAQNAAEQNLKGLEKPEAVPAQQNSGGKRLNPAHGQPGHDCAVAVGDPLP